MEFRYLSESEAGEASAFVHDMWVDTYAPILRGGRQRAESIFDDWVGPARIVSDMSKGHFFIYMMDGERRIGLLSAGKEGDALEISKIYLLPECRGKGYGKEALGFLLSKGREMGCRSAYLEVNQDNAPALEFYGKNGFRPVDFRRYEYSATVIMAAELRPP